MFGIETLSGNARAAALVGVVLLEALLLYGGYGGLEAVFGPAIRRALSGAAGAGAATGGGEH
jgi:hypothetical protein